MKLPNDPINWFSETVRLTGLAHTGPELEGHPKFIGKRVGLINGSCWVIPWANYFGKKYIPGAHLVNVGNDALQISFMESYEKGLSSIPQINLDTFVNYARDLVTLGNVDLILITCSTMNRSYPLIVNAMDQFKVPVVQIDQPMMDKAANGGGRVLVLATHGPTVASTQALLLESATKTKSKISLVGETIEEAWHHLADGEITKHNTSIERAIRRRQKNEPIDSVVLAQLSMSVFLLSYPQPEKVFGIPVYTSGKLGFERVAEILMNQRLT